MNRTLIFTALSLVACGRAVDLPAGVTINGNFALSASLQRSIYGNDASQSFALDLSDLDAKPILDATVTVTPGGVAMRGTSPLEVDYSIHLPASSSYVVDITRGTETARLELELPSDCDVSTVPELPRQGQAFELHWTPKGASDRVYATVTPFVGANQVGLMQGPDTGLIDVAASAVKDAGAYRAELLRDHVLAWTSGKTFSSVHVTTTRMQDFVVSP